MAATMCFSLLFITATTIFVLQSIFKKFTAKTSARTTTKNFHLPPSPPALPVIGRLHHLLLNPSSFYKTLSFKYGPLLYLHLGSSRCLLVSSVSTASEIFRTHDLAFASRPLFAFADKLPYGNSGFVTAPYGEYWKFMKKLCVMELLGTRQLERSYGIRQEEVVRFLGKFLESAARNEVVNVGAQLTKLTNNLTCRMVMSTRCSGEDGEADRCRELVKESFELAIKIAFGDVLGPLKILGFWLYGRRALDMSKRYDELLEKILKEHEDRAKRDGWEREDKDLIDILLRIQLDGEAEAKLTRTHIKAFLLDLFIAGTETSATAMQWTLAELINHPEVLKKVRQEIESVVGKFRLVEESDISNLPYLQAVVKEAIRLHPPAPVLTRECRQNCKVKGFDVPEKTAVAVNLYAIMRDPEKWDKPNDFFPERFLGSSRQGLDKNNLDHDQIGSTGQDFGFVPFGAGRRGCPGKMLAYSMMNTVIAAMVQCFDWKLISGLKDGSGLQKVKMEARSGMSMGMAHPLLCVPVVHFNPF